MKIVRVDGQISDKSGLYFDLVKAGFEVGSVSGEKGSTYIHLEDEEDKDPLPIADLWIGKAMEKPSLSLIKERRAIHERHLSGKAARLAALRMRIQVQPEPAYAYENAGDGVQVLTMESPQKENWFKKIMKLW